MFTPHRLSHVVAVLALVGLSINSSRTWGQTPPASPPQRLQEQRSSPSPRVGSVLIFERRVQHQRHDDQRWQPVKIEQLIIDQDRVRTGERSKVSVQLLRPRYVETIPERTEAYFSSKGPECKFPPQQESRVVELSIGLIHIIGKFLEVHTPNAVICVQGTTALVHFTTPPDTTEVINVVGNVEVWNQKADPAEPQKITLEKSVTLQTNSRVLVVGPRNDSHFALTEELWREGPLLPPRDSHIVLLSGRRDEVLAPQIGSDPQTQALTPDTSPRGIEFIRSTLLGIDVLFPR